MLDLILVSLQILFSLMMTGLLGLFIFFLLLSWAWAQHESDKNGASIGLSEILTTAGVEWGAYVTILACHLGKLTVLWEAPRFEEKDLNSKIKSTQLPVILVPSMHFGSSMFRFLYFRLRSHFFKSLWPFAWKSFLQDSSLLEDQLARFLQEVLDRTGSQEFNLISFGSSHPIVSRCLSRPQFASKSFKWISISGPRIKSAPMKLLSTARIRSAFGQEPGPQTPTVQIAGQVDILCYPSEIFGLPEPIYVPNVGHYGVLLHSKTTQSILEALR